MKTLVTGASGMLGSAVMRELKARGEKERRGWSGSVGKTPDGTVLEISDLTRKGVKRALLLDPPELIVHCAALTDADFCQKNPGDAQEVNALVPGMMARYAKELEARFVYVSTDAVYDDAFSTNRAEDSPLNPRSVYAETKLEGEGRVLSAYPEALVVRTTMFGWTLSTAPRPKLAEQILGALTARRPIKLWLDAYFSPLHVEMLAYVLLDLGETDAFGVLNVGSRHSVRKSDFGYILADAFGLDASFIEQVKVDEVPLPARRTKNVGLNVKKVERLMGWMPTVTDGIDQLYREAHDGTAVRIRGREGYP